MKNVRKWTFFTKQSPKNDKKFKKFHKIQNVHSIWFPHGFSILGPFDHVGWVPDAPEPQDHKIGLGAA